MGPTYGSAPQPASSPSGWAVSPWSLLAGEGPGILGWLEGLRLLSGTACLPPSGLLKSLKDSQKRERDLEDSIYPEAPEGMACASPGLGPGQEGHGWPLGRALVNAVAVGMIPT